MISGTNNIESNSYLTNKNELGEDPPSRDHTAELPQFLDDSPR